MSNVTLKIVLPLCGCLCVFAGCGKEAATPTGANLDAGLEDMNRELRMWVVRHQRVPASFEEFSGSVQSPVPAPPPGKKFTINSKQMKVVVVSR